MPSSLNVVNQIVTFSNYTRCSLGYRQSKFVVIPLLNYCLIPSTAEFVISLAEKEPTFDGFKALLLQNGAEFTVSLPLQAAAFVRKLELGS